MIGKYEATTIKILKRQQQDKTAKGKRQKKGAIILFQKKKSLQL